MATLVLSTVGTILGGPVGGAIGSLLGQSIDQQLLGPGSRHGPRLGDLAVQSSSYDSAIPKIYGTMRVAGTVVWATDLKELSQTQSAKSQPETVTYSYSASFAVALSSRPIARIGRIWADGKLIRGADGVFSVATDFRVYEGSEDQQPDPLIASIERLESTPAYRGVAMAVFEELQLADFGNRIPFLTFEVIADEGPVAVGTILGDASGNAIACSASAEVSGYAAYGSSVAAAVEPLVNLFAVTLFDNGTALASPLETLVPTPEADAGCSADERRVPRAQRSQSPAASLPTELALGYYDPARDYQAGLARASLDDRGGTSSQMELPAALEAATAKGLAETSLARRWAERDKLTLRLPPSYLNLEPGCLLQPNGIGHLWRAERLTLEAMAVVAELSPVFATIDAVPADEGRVLSSPLITVTPTDLAILELPDDGTGSASQPVVAVAASSGGTWRAVPLQVDVGGAQSTVRSARLATIMGSTLSALAPGQSTLLDLVGSVDVALDDAQQWLESCDDDALCAGANLAIAGEELFQFGQAIPLREGVFRLTRLLRGRRGTEWAMAAHAQGERFALLDPARLAILPLDRSTIGALIRVTPSGIGDDGSNFVERVVRGDAMKPPSPVHVRAEFNGAGDLKCTWVRRSNSGWDWLDGVEVPLGGATELYRVTLTGAGGSLELESTTASLAIGAEQLAGVGSEEVQIQVRQVGDFALSIPAVLTIAIE